MGIFEMFLSTSDVQTSASLFLSMASHDKVYIETLASQEDMYSMSPMDSQSQPQHHHKSLSLSSHEIAKPVSNSRSHPCRSSRDKTPQETTPESAFTHQKTYQKGSRQSIHHISRNQTRYPATSLTYQQSTLRKRKPKENSSSGIGMNHQHTPFPQVHPQARSSTQPLPT
jgi:hypothetical protein